MVETWGQDQHNHTSTSWSTMSPPGAMFCETDENLARALFHEIVSFFVKTRVEVVALIINQKRFFMRLRININPSFYARCTVMNVDHTSVTLEWGGASDLWVITQARNHCVLTVVYRIRTRGRILNWGLKFRFEKCKSILSKQKSKLR